MTYARECGFKVDKECIVAGGECKGSKVLFVKDYITTCQEFLFIDGTQVFIHIDDFDVAKYINDCEKPSTLKQILVKYIDKNTTKMTS